MYNVYECAAYPSREQKTINYDHLFLYCTFHSWTSFFPKIHVHRCMSLLRILMLQADVNVHVRDWDCTNISQNCWVLLQHIPLCYCTTQPHAPTSGYLAGVLYAQLIHNRRRQLLNHESAGDTCLVSVVIKQSAFTKKKHPALTQSGSPGEHGSLLHMHLLPWSNTLLILFKKTDK